ncbi:hypothetical protein DMJ13_19230 [halophilic archaeon]|nr:hypothetical protein DMJ13_19230 [halophilic archaeon]
MGYIHIGAAVRPRRVPLTLLPPGRKKSQLLGRLKELTDQLEQLDDVETTTVFDAVAIPPFERLPNVSDRRRSVPLPRFDVVVLVETSSPEVVTSVQESSVFGRLVELLERDSKYTYVTTARNEKRLGDVDKSRDGLFIFNYFLADDADRMLELFEYLAGWHVAETGLDNSTLLVPLDQGASDYVAINNARWDLRLPTFLWRQFSKRTFRTYVLANLRANRAVAMPVLYRLA